MKAIIISVSPRKVADILNGKRDVLTVKKPLPLGNFPIVPVFVYCKEGSLLVRDDENPGKFKARRIRSDDPTLEVDGGKGCLPDVAGNGKIVAKFMLKGIMSTKHWIISDLVFLSEPKALSEFGLEKAPREWEFVEAKDK